MRLRSFIMGKRGRLEPDAEETVRSLCRIGSISHKGLEELLRRVRAQPSVLDVGHTELTRQMHARFEEVRSSVDMPLTDGNVFKWEIADPVLLTSKLSSLNFAVISSSMQRKNSAGKGPPSP